MYFIVFAITMMFGAFISAYIVSSMGQYWVYITPPPAFIISNVIITAASVTLFLANRAIKKGEVGKMKAMLYTTFILGSAFVFTQFSGWKDLSAWGNGWNNRPTEFGIATSWNSIETLLNGAAVYGKDYEVKINGESLIFDEKTGELYDPIDELKLEPVTDKVKVITNTSSGYLWVLILVHLLHLVFGLVYLLVNIVRAHKGVLDKENNIQIYTLGIYWHFLFGLWLVLFFILFSV